MLEKGLIQVYTSESEEMNYAPFGLCLRAAGQGLRSLIICFAPYELMEGASLATSILKPNLVIDHSAAERTLSGREETNGDKNKITRAFQRAKDALFHGEHDIVVLHGIHRIIHWGLFSLEDILHLMEEKPGNVELVLTGPGASDKLIDRADLVTEMVCHVNKDRLEKDSGQGGTAPIEVVTGNGKGKTTYCLGKALFMSCVGIRSLFLQFIKSPLAYGEIKAIEKLPYLEVKTMGEGFLNRHTGSPQKKHLEAARRAWEECLRDIFSLKYGLIILDEINIATHYGLIHPERVKEMLFLKPEKLHLILSGRNAHPEVRQGATTVIEMKEIKHPFTKGIKARKGIEF